MKKIFRTLLSVLVLGSFLLACEDDFTSPALPTGSTITEIIVTSEDHDILEAALVKTGLATIYADNNSGTFTVFAPDDASFITFLGVADEAAAIAAINALTNTSSPINLGALVTRLNYHILTSELKSAQITGAQTQATLNGARLSLSLTAGSVLINTGIGASGATVTTADLDASNGVVHSINKVLTAPATNTTILSTFGLSINYSVSPPNNITGGSETGGDTNGNDFDLLAYALRKAELVDDLNPNATLLPDFTIFAPTDNAIRAYLGDTQAVTKALEDAAIQSLKALPTADLANLLKYHVLAGRYLSTDLSNDKSLATLLPNASFVVKVSTDPSPIVTLDDNNVATNPTVTAVNTVHNNGVVHTINAVLRSN